MIKPYLTILGLLFMLNTAWADTPSQASLERLFALQDFDKMIDDTIQQVQKQHLIDINQLPTQVKNLSKEKQAALIQVVNRYTVELMNAINTPDTRAQIRHLAIDSARKIYTQQEVNALIQFYSTPEGHSVLAKQARYFDAIFTPMMQVVGQKLNRFQKSKESELSQELSQIVCGQSHC